MSPGATHTCSCGPNLVRQTPGTWGRREGLYPTQYIERGKQILFFKGICMYIMVFIGGIWWYRSAGVVDTDEGGAYI